MANNFIEKPVGPQMLRIEKPLGISRAHRAETSPQKRQYDSSYLYLLTVCDAVQYK